MALYVLGWLSLGLGIVGIFLPLLPTTPFVLLAAFCFSRSSNRWHLWLRQHPYLGLLIRDWEAHRAIGMRAKATATSLILATFVVSLIATEFVSWHKWILLLIGGGVLLYIWTRPFPPDGPGS